MFVLIFFVVFSIISNRYEYTNEILFIVLSVLFFILFLLLIFIVIINIDKIPFPNTISNIMDYFVYIFLIWFEWWENSYYGRKVRDITGAVLAIVFVLGFASAIVYALYKSVTK